MGSFQVLTTAGARMQHDQFPSTHATQIIELLASGAAGQSKVRSDVMARYHAALTIYARGSSLAHVMDADELVNTFFATRLSREDFFEHWRASGLRLRKWLINGLHFCAREQHRMQRQQHRRWRSIADSPENDLVVSADASNAAERAFDHARATHILAHCADVIRASFALRDQPQAWECFRRHHVDGASYRVIAAERGLTVRALNSMVRAVTAELRSAVRAELLREGITEDELDQELNHIEEALRP